jgi:hypothetical protein
MRARRLAATLGIGIALLPIQGDAARWGSAGYGDPPGFCPAQSPMWTTTVVTNDPLVRDNPEQDTFWGIHAYPGYDDWYGFWYGDFRGSPGDASGWRFIATSLYGHTRRWNFADWGWAVHGHAKQYIAYYNWTFGGQCAMGHWGTGSPPPYMADVYGYPVVDIYVDSVPPYAPQPRTVSVSANAVKFAWDPVADRGDGSGPDLFTSGLDHYTSWWTSADGKVHDLASTANPRTVTAGGLRPGQQACVHVQAVDRVGNATPESVRCATTIHPPSLDRLHLDAGAVVARPAALGLVGLPTWFALAPPPQGAFAQFVEDGVTYDLTATPTGARWLFGDGAELALSGSAAFGELSAADAASHAYETQSQGGYDVDALVDFAVSWTATASGVRLGPYPAGTVSVAARPLTYPVEQAQPELLLSAAVSAA